MPGRIFQSLVAFSATAGLCSVSHALGVHEGFPARQLMQKLNAENQKVMVMASQSIISPAIKDIAVLFTADREGGTGYILESDKGLDEPGGTFHVVARYTDVRLNFNRVAPRALFAGTDPILAKEQCKQWVNDGKLGANTCNSLNETVENRARNDERVLLWGISTEGTKIIVSGDVQDSDGSPAEKDNGAGSLDFSSLQGGTFLGRPFHQVTTTDDFTALLSERGK